MVSGVPSAVMEYYLVVGFHLDYAITSFYLRWCILNLGMKEFHMFSQTKVFVKL